MIFTDAFERTIDEKNRLQIPATHREVLDPERQGAILYVVPGERDNTLSLYPERYFESKAASIPTDETPGEDSLAFEQMFFSTASRVEMDKQGRLVLPERHLAVTELGKEVYVTGSRDRLDVWNKSGYEQFLREVSTRRKELQRILRTPGRVGSKDRSESSGS